MADIAGMLDSLRQQNNALAANLTEKGVPAAGGDGLVALTEKVKRINQHIASGTKETVRVSAAGAVHAGDFVAFVDELVGGEERQVETGSVVGSDFIGGRRVAVAFVRGGSLYLKAVGQEESGALALGNSVLVASGAAPATAEVIGQTDGAAVVYVHQGTTWVAKVTYAGLTGTLGWVDAIDVDNGANVTGCALEDGKLLVCLSHDETVTTYPEKVVQTDGMARMLNVVGDLQRAYIDIYSGNSSAVWDPAGNNEQEVAYNVGWFLNGDADSADSRSVWDQLTAEEQALPMAREARAVIGSIDLSTGAYTASAELTADAEASYPGKKWGVFVIMESRLKMEYEAMYKEANKTVRAIRPSVALTVTLGASEATVSTERLGFLPETDEYLQSWSVASLTPNLVALAWFEDYEQPMGHALLKLTAKEGMERQCVGKCVTVGSMPSVSVVPLAADCCGIAGAVRRVGSTNETLLVFEGWYGCMEYTTMQPYYWGVEDRSVGTNISRVYVDVMGTDYAVLGCVLDGTLKCTVIALNGTRPESGPTVALCQTGGYARLHGMNGSYALGVVERSGKVYVGVYQRTRTALKADGMAMDALAAESAAAGGNVAVYSA